MASGLMPGFDALIRSAWRERGFGDFWGYALVAEGAAEAMLETGMYPWDLAAPLVLIEEAGGRVTDVNGERRIDAPSFVGSNGLVHDEILRRLRTEA
jgi:histidinol-phosphatase